MDTPLKYYGGKQQLADRIISLIPKHKIYCEPFAGGAAVFFHKQPSEVETLNDTNHELINFYEVCKLDFEALEREISITLHSRELHHRASIIYNNPDKFDKIKRAWAVWVLSCQSYLSKFNGTWGYDRLGSTTKNVSNKRDNFTWQYARRLERVQLECDDALKVIRRMDTIETFFYCDPPYVDTDQGHYDGYSQDDFDALITVLERIEGKFLLSSYPNEHLYEAVKRNGWISFEIQMCKTASRNAENEHGTKTEVLTANYPIAADAESLYYKYELDY